MKASILIIPFLINLCGAIENDCVDGIKIGMNISTFLNKNRGKYNVIQESISLEGDEYPIFNVYKNSELIYAVEPDENLNKIWRIWVYGKKFKTELGIGVGDTIGDLKNRYTIKEILTGDGNVALLVKEIHVSFLIDVSQVSSEWWNIIDLEDLDNEIKIDSIII